jgi:hypothetical protein
MVIIKMTEGKNLSKPRWEDCYFLWLLISFSGRTKQIFFLIIKLEPWLLSWSQPRKNNFASTELDVSISATVFLATCTDYSWNEWTKNADR